MKKVQKVEAPHDAAETGIQGPQTTKRLRQLQSSVGSTPDTPNIALDKKSWEQKNWFEKYVNGEKGFFSWGTLGKALRFDWARGVGEGLTGKRWVGELTRAAAIAAALWFGFKWIAGSEIEAANTLGNQVITAGNNLTPVPSVVNPTNSIGVIGNGGMPASIPYNSAPIGSVPQVIPSGPAAPGTFGANF